MDFSNLDITKILGVVVGIASLLANVIPAHTIVGKFVHLLAGNWNSKTMPQAPDAGGTP